MLHFSVLVVLSHTIKFRRIHSMAVFTLLSNAFSTGNDILMLCRPFEQNDLSFTCGCSVFGVRAGHAVERVGYLLKRRDWKLTASGKKQCNCTVVLLWLYAAWTVWFLSPVGAVTCVLLLLSVQLGDSGGLTLLWIDCRDEESVEMCLELVKRHYCSVFT